MEFPLYVSCTIAAFLFVSLLMALATLNLPSEGGGSNFDDYRDHKPYNPPAERTYKARGKRGTTAVWWNESERKQ